MCALQMKTFLTSEEKICLWYIGRPMTFQILLKKIMYITSQYFPLQQNFDYLILCGLSWLLPNYLDSNKIIKLGNILCVSVYKCFCKNLGNGRL